MRGERLRWPLACALVLALGHAGCAKEGQCVRNSDCSPGFVCGDVGVCEIEVPDATPIDAEPDAGIDAGTDAGIDAGIDAAPPDAAPPDAAP